MSTLLRDYRGVIVASGRTIRMVITVLVTILAGHICAYERKVLHMRVACSLNFLLGHGNFATIS